MKYARLSLFFLITAAIIGCHAKAKNKGNNIDRFKVNHIAKYKLNNTQLRDSIPVVGLPFGSSIFSSYKFPKVWADIMRHGKHINRPDIELVKIDTFFNNLNRSKSFNKNLSNFQVEYVHYDDDSLMTHDEKLLGVGYIAKLPQIGPYQCYYKFNKVDGWFNGDNPYINYNQYGDLIFIDIKKQKVKILNVFCYGQVGDLETVYRYFYINSDSVIEVFKREGYDHLTMKSTVIKVLDNGEFSIMNLE